MSEFSFIPRKLTRTTKKVTTQLESPSVAGPSRLQIVDKDNINDLPSKNSKVEIPSENLFSDDAYATLLKLILSDYSISSNLELKQKLLHDDNDYFVPLSYLMNVCPLSSYMTPSLTETVLIRSIRTFAADYIEARMIISSPSDVWRNPASEFGVQGGYEVRRKDWKFLDAVCKDGWQQSRIYWESRTLYIENLLPDVRTVPAISMLIEDVLLLKSPSSTKNPVQYITFPPHYNDPRESLMASTSKGFAFVVFTTYEDTKIFLEEWPWDIKNPLARVNHNGDIITRLHDCGFRTVAKARWKSLMEEYMTRKQDLLANAIFDSQKPLFSREQSSSMSQNTSLVPRNNNVVLTSQTDSYSPPDYPIDCLVFVKNIHPECNKTTLRTLLSAAFNNVVDYINYVDYNKGMDSCYIRLAAPQYSKTLVEYFASNSLTQKDGLDGHGSNKIPKNVAPIHAELIQEKREKIYWERVPTKIKQQALSLAQTKGSESILPDESTQRRKRKRR